MQNTEAKIKKLKKVIICTSAALLVASTTFFVSLGLTNNNPSTEDFKTKQTQSSSDKHTQTPKYRSLEELRKVKLPTHTEYFDGVPYQVVDEEDVLKLSREFKYAIQDYFESRGAIYWTNNDTKQFWPKDIEYIVTAMAFNESTYRTDVSNDKGCVGLLGIRKADMLKSINGWANDTTIWGKDIPYVNCNPDEVDVYNPVTAIEYTYYYMGYHLANVLKKDTTFNYNGKEHCLWDYTKFSSSKQTKLLVASHFWGYGNLTTSALGINEQGYTLDTLLDSQYVTRVINKYQDLIELERKQQLNK